MNTGKSIDNYDRNQHSVYLLYYHLILVVKYRRRVFDDMISERAKEIFCYIAKGYDITLEEWNLLRSAADCGRNISGAEASACLRRVVHRWR